MKRFLFYCGLFLLFACAAHGQMLNPVTWNFRAEKNNDSAYTLHMKATIGAGWHIYAQDAGEGPIPTSFKFDSNKKIILIGKVEGNGNLKKAYDKAFDSQLQFYEKEVDFVQQVKLNGVDGATVKGSLEFMVCNDVNCLPPKTIPFSFKLGLADQGIESTADQSASVTAQAAASQAATEAADSITQKISEETASSATDINRLSLWAVFLLGLVSGLWALIMPCIYAMIPVTVSFFTKKSETRGQGIRNAIYYSLSIIFIFTALGFLGSLLFGPRFMNELSSSAIFNIFVFLIFLIFGISFLGAFEITLPASWSSKMDSKANMSGFGGIFFMALTLVIVSFSCTAPFIGNLLILTVKGQQIAPIIGFFGFSLAIAIPFAFFALFPGLLNNLAKSGGWLNTVKITLGFIEIALAMKFLSSADLAYHWNLLNRNVYLSIWIVIFGLLGLYLLGKIKFAHDSKVQHLSVLRLFFAIAALSFSVYMIPGLWGAPLNAISGWLPETKTQEFNLYKLQVERRDNTISANDPLDGIRPQKYTNILQSEIPGVTTFFDYDEAVAAAKKLHKPIMIDFTGHACANCRKMESDVLSKPEVQQMLRNDFVVASLYVDDRTTLPENEQYVSKLDGSRITNMGAKNLDFEANKINSNAQPNYVFVDPQGNILADAGGYNSDVQRFVNILKDVLQKYKAE